VNPIFKTQDLRPKTSKGQTALEYLLIVAIVITVLLAVVVWMQAASVTVINDTENQTYNIRCTTTECDDNDDCNARCGENKAECVIHGGASTGLCEIK
jgi:hypothetical protein